MARLVLVRPIHFPPGREEVGLQWLRSAMEARRRAGMEFSAIMRSRTDPYDYLSLMIWPDEHAYNRWNSSADRAALFASQPHFIVREPTRRYTLIEP